ncbi:hypothetical protein LUX33_36280 [Actinomadura madurae]|nr:hypothetical protein [Actinomadura madurae]MCP9953360.1 hypothetical protein [Actinomadura madurae]
MHDRGHLVVAERRASGGGERHRRAPGEHVGRGTDLASREVLGGHVGGGPDVLGLTGRAQRARHPEVDDARTVRAHHDVVRLEVAVHDAGLVDGGESRQGADGEPFQGAASARAVGPHDMVQGQPGDVLADYVRLISRHVGVENLRGAETRDALGDFQLPDEARAGGLVPCHAAVHELDGDVVRGPRGAALLGGTAQEDRALPALAQAAQDLVAAQSGRIARPQWKGVRHRPVRHTTRSPSLPAHWQDCQQDYGQTMVCAPPSR